MRSFAIAAAAFLFKSAIAGTTVWTGSFDAYSTSADFDKWTWSNLVGEYQWYIHGSQPTSHYLNLASTYKNPASSEKQGLKLTIDGTSLWNGQTMQRSELIPQTTSNLGTGQMFYHFSVKHSGTNVPITTQEHQVLFFESHFTEFKYGIAPDVTQLQWCVGGVPKWSTAFTADTWYNFAYDINFSSGNVGLWASTGSSPLVKVVANIAASTSTNSADWHLGVLRLGSSTAAEDWYFSGVYIESGTINTSVGTGVGTTTSSSSSSTTTTTTTTSSTTTTTTTTAPGPTQTHYGQCGGTGWTGPTVCASPYTCNAVSPPYYSQCL
jgi:hypothetical protein